MNDTPQNKQELNINPEKMLLPSPEVISFLAKVTNQTEKEIMKVTHPNPYLIQIHQIRQCTREAFSLNDEYSPDDKIVPLIDVFIETMHMQKSYQGDKNTEEYKNINSKSIAARNSIKLYFSSKEEFWNALGHTNLNEQKSNDIADEMGSRFKKLFELLEQKIKYISS